MKKSLKHPLLFLSLAAVLAVGTGCERRGRAPVKKSASAPVNTDHATSPTGVTDPNANKDPNKKDETVTDENKKPTLYEDTAAEARKAGQIDVRLDLVNEAPTQESFMKDLELFGIFKGRLAEHGLVLSASYQHPEKFPEAYILEERDGVYVGLKRQKRADGNDGQEANLSDEFKRLAALEGSDENKAIEILEARLEVLALESEKMARKYRDADSSIGYSMNDGDLEIKQTAAEYAAELELVRSLVEKAKKEVNSNQEPFDYVTDDGEVLGPGNDETTAE